MLFSVKDLKAVLDSSAILIGNMQHDYSILKTSGLNCDELVKSYNSLISVIDSCYRQISDCIDSLDYDI